MLRLAHLDVPNLVRPYAPPLLTQVAFAVLCSAAGIGLRFLTDIWLPGAGTFALTIPIVLIATLFGRWLCGLITQTVTSLYAWYYVLPIQGSFEIADPSDGPRIAVNLIAGYFVVALAEIFRAAMRRALDDRQMLLLELQHRVKNNFASIAAVLRLQMNSADEETTKALQTALGRVESFAHAHSFIYLDFDRTGLVNMQGYITELCAMIRASFDTEDIRITCAADPALLPRDRAILIGLLINEVVTNSAKHAFAGRQSGVVEVHFTETPQGFQLSVSDNGHGMEDGSREGSLGMKLIEALTAQARGTVESKTGPIGTSFHFEFAR
jgi:two-component sensor histidine kinase